MQDWVDAHLLTVLSPQRKDGIDQLIAHFGF